MPTSMTRKVTIWLEVLEIMAQRAWRSFLQQNMRWTMSWSVP